MSLEKRALRGTIASVVSLVVQLGLQIVSVPILLDRWGQEEYGVWLAINSLFGLLITIDAGHQNYVGNELLQTIPADLTTARRQIQAGIAGSIVTATLELALVVCLAAAGTLVTLAAVPQARALDLYVCLGSMLVAWMVAGSAGGILTRIYQPLGEFARATWLGLLQRSLVSLTPVLVSLGGGSIRQAAIIASSIPVAAMGLVLFDLRRHTQLHPFVATPDWKLVRRNLFRSLWLTGTGFLSQAQQHVFLLVVAGGMGGVGALPAFTTMRTVANIFLQAASTLSAPMLPDIVRLKAAGELQKLELLLRSIASLTTFAMGVALAAALPVLPFAYAVWTRSQLTFNSPLYALLASAVLVRILASPMQSLLAGVNALVPLAVASAVQFAVTIVAGLLLVPRDGLRGAGLSLLLGEVASSLLVPLVALSLRDKALLGLVRPSAAALAAAPTLFLVLAFVLHSYCAIAATSIAVAVLVLQISISLPLWLSFPEHIRMRLLKLAHVG